MSKRTQLLHKLKHVYSHNAKLVLDVENKDIELIIDGLEKQIAKKPKAVKLEKGVSIGSTYWGKGTTLHKCICGQHLTRIYQYCLKCGQKLDWRD